MHFYFVVYIVVLCCCQHYKGDIFVTVYSLLFFCKLTWVQSGFDNSNNAQYYHDLCTLALWKTIAEIYSVQMLLFSLIKMLTAEQQCGHTVLQFYVPICLYYCISLI